mmetsp:Transcript_15151/g.34787  ORF Transcript_15151/g.34787 Transcript_15151/m.34787 type:complete len:241 (+) Transcript_15151:946-1668(+)
MSSSVRLVCVSSPRLGPSCLLRGGGGSISPAEWRGEALTHGELLWRKRGERRSIVRLSALCVRGSVPGRSSTPLAPATPTAPAGPTHAGLDRGSAAPTHAGDEATHAGDERGSVLGRRGTRGSAPKPKPGAARWGPKEIGVPAALGAREMSAAPPTRGERRSRRSSQHAAAECRGDGAVQCSGDCHAPQPCAGDCHAPQPCAGDGDGGACLDDATAHSASARCSPATPRGDGPRGGASPR